MSVEVFLIIDVLLTICIFYIFIKLHEIEKVDHEVSNEIYKLISRIKAIINDNSDIITKDMKNEELINKMNNVGLIRFIKERFNLPDYCKMCNNFNPIDSNEDICRFKGMFGTKCEEGFEKWLKDVNNLEGDMNADIN